MKTRNLIIGLVVVVAVGSFVFWQTQMNRVEQSTIAATTNTQTTQTETTGQTSAPIEQTNPQATGTTTKTPAQSQPQQTQTTPTTPGGITLADVAKHNDSSSCWSAINGNVYDLTSWIPQHPGGQQAILSICGINGSGAFNAMHGGRPRQAAILAGFKIGVLVN